MQGFIKRCEIFSWVFFNSLLPKFVVCAMRTDPVLSHIKTEYMKQILLGSGPSHESSIAPQCATVTSVWKHPKFRENHLHSFAISTVVLAFFALNSIYVLRVTL